MPRIVTEGETQTRGQRSRRAGWLIAGFVTLLIGYPLGFFLVMGRAWNDAFTWLYVGLALVALAAAFGFARARGRRPVPADGRAGRLPP